MATKKKSTSDATIKPNHVVEVAVRKDDNLDAATSATLTRPEVHAAVTIQQWQGLHNVNALAKTLSLQIDAVNNGDMSRPEAMLISQAHTLDELFNNLAQRAIRQDTIPRLESYLRLALKAQTQCRATLETLSNIKNPPVIFAKQANISNGHQQINNGAPSPTTYAEEIKNQQNKLLEVNDGERLDTRAKTTASGIDKDMETVGKINRPKDNRRQGSSIS